MIWFTSDLHFCHTNIIKHAERPFKSTEEMNEVLIQRWNEKVAEEDYVYILGDLSWAAKGKTLPLVKRLKGNKILIKGNHDNLTKTAYKDMEFLAVFDSCSYSLYGKKVNLSHYPYYPNYLEIGYVWIKETIKRMLGIRLAHAQRKTLKKRLKDDGRWLLHGHVHAAWKVKRNMINVGVDVNDFYPVSLEDIKDIIEENK